MTRKKEPEIFELVDKLQDFETLVTDYRNRLATELEAEREQQAYRPLVSGLERQIELLHAFEAHLDEEVWEYMLIIANMSQSISHRRTRRFF